MSVFSTKNLSNPTTLGALAVFLAPFLPQLGIPLAIAKGLGVIGGILWGIFTVGHPVTPEDVVAADQAPTKP